MANTPLKTPFDQKSRRLKKSMASALLLGMIRGIGMAIGFSGFAVVLLFVTKILPLDKLPLVGKIISAIINRS